MAVTIKDVASRLNLSISTVSKAFNDYADISPATRDRVLQTAHELGYFPNATARTLKTNRSLNLGVLFVDDNNSGLTHNFFAAVLDAVKSESERQGYDVTFINHNMGHTGMTYLEHCRYRNVDGVCLACVDFYDPEVVELVQSGLPCVTIDHPFAGRTCVLSENVQGMEMLVERAWELGHRRIAYVHGRRSAVTDARIRGFRKALAAHGAAPASEYLMEAVYGDPSFSRRAVRTLLRLPTPPTCIILPDDYAALGATEALAEAGLSCPGDVSIAGYDGIPLTQLLKPRLTTIAQDTKAMGTKAADALISLIENPSTSQPEVISVPCRLLCGSTMDHVHP